MLTNAGLDVACSKYPHLPRSRLLLVTGGPSHRVELIELEDQSWDMKTSRVRPGTEATLVYVSKGKYQGLSDHAEFVEFPLLELVSRVRAPLLWMWELLCEILS